MLVAPHVRHYRILARKVTAMLIIMNILLSGNVSDESVTTDANIVSIDCVTFCLSLSVSTGFV